MQPTDTRGYWAKAARADACDRMEADACIYVYVWTKEYLRNWGPAGVPSWEPMWYME